MPEGLFVTIEGIDGAGKTTVVEAIEEEYAEAVTTSEPSTLNTGVLVRELLQQEDSHPITDFMAFMADRVKHIDEVVEPALEEGKLVVSDRYADSTRAYQPLFLKEYIDNPHVYIEDVIRPWNRTPDITIEIRISPQTAMSRVTSGEKYEKGDMLRKVHHNYQMLSRTHSARWNIVDGEQSQEKVIQDVVEIIDARI